MLTSKLNTALEALVQRGKPGERVFAREKAFGSLQSREYCIMSPDVAWRETQSKTNPHLYEVLSAPCNMYLDIEWKCKSPPCNEKKVLQDIVDITTHRLRDEYDVGDIAVHTASASGWVKGEYKCSWHVHIVCSKVCWSNAACVGDFVRRNLSDVPEVDKIPYHAPKQNWRCIGSSKANDPQRAFLPSNKQIFMDCLVGCEVGQRTVLGPKISCKRPIACPVPPHVLALARSLGNMRTDSMIQMGNRFWCVPFKGRIVCRIAGRMHRSNHQYAVIDMWGMRWRQKCHSAGCQSQEAPWVAFENVDLARRIWHEYVLPKMTSPPPRPAIRAQPPCDNTCVRYLPRQRGPPARVPAGTLVKCMNGYYRAAE